MRHLVADTEVCGRVITKAAWAVSAKLPTAESMCTGVKVKGCRRKVVVYVPCLAGVACLPVIVTGAQHTSSPVNVHAWLCGEFLQAPCAGQSEGHKKHVICPQCKRGGIALHSKQMSSATLENTGTAEQLNTPPPYMMQRRCLLL
jgi:hypothetical protein